MLYFFLSYARGGDDVYVRQFFSDLCHEVRVLEGLGRDVEVGFLDARNIHPGQAWSESLIDALAQSRSFLALCSPAYFLSEPCGKEWAIFEERVEEHERRTGQRPPGLIPLQWLPPRTLPPTAARIQYFEEPVGAGQQADQRLRGIRQLLRLQRNRDDYLEFVTLVAERVVEASLVDPMPPMQNERRQRFEAVASAFHKPVPVHAGAVNGVQPGPIADVEMPISRKVYFVMSAPTRVEAEDEELGRRDRRFYGDSAPDWAPYRPSSEEALASYATRIAHERSLLADVIEVGELEQCIARAERDNQIVVLLVDPWSTQMPRYHEILKDYDGRDEPSAAVMIPWSRDDSEIRDNAQRLHNSINETFPRNVRKPPNTLFRPAVMSTEIFGADLHVVLEESRNLVMAKGRARRPLPDPPSSRPVIES
ncbi:TIR-like protein FxsC [Actinoplanes sp. L3-i22]|uniref:TIR-like protein FxsC n=1 Tax=Actinoplanes sp. L3-i22 TaxID=2836373 RepID=UPI001C770CE5|nr:TIR-like protein FxsC [Actinoplanes sp. L3-i22]BCY13147.1 hypothetical protein L3i22_082350 [Actinoplanes sp. L3-i22]